MNGRNFTNHVRERAAATIVASHGIKNLSQLSIITAMKLFDLKILPILIYGVDITWNHLTKRNLRDIERVKSTFLKRAMCLSKHTPSRLTYVLARETYAIEDIRQKWLLPNTAAYVDLVQEVNAKRKEIWLEFYGTDAMGNTDWMRAKYILRHLITRFAVHGIHHKICSVKNDVIGDQCVCQLCGNKCDLYHVLACAKRPTSLSQFCED
jgi:hypothetical protein